MIVGGGIAGKVNHAIKQRLDHDCFAYQKQSWSSSNARRWLIGGRVQGVGFRPFACVLAQDLGISGSVRNHHGQVEIVAHGDPDREDQFLRRLLSEHPPIARPELCFSGLCETPPVGFRILPSVSGDGTGPAGVVLADQSLCEPCRTEMMDPAARRHRYPFITCTQCGPRYTIIAKLPFDRAATAMAGFPLCTDCLAEYQHPGDRRFHAQGTSCPTCGPRLRVRMGDETISGNDESLARSVAVLRTGGIVAARGIGGYHLMCDAASDAAVRRLRARKRRPAQPLAVLFPRDGADGLDHVRRHCLPDSVTAACLRAPARPIVMVALRTGATLSAWLAPGLLEIGAMLPYSPLHDLLTHDFGGPLVATSGNVSGEPIFSDCDEAERHLAAVADAFLHHDRPILRPADDGVVRVIAGRARPLRLGRGSAPLAHALPRRLTTPVLALGGQMKATLALGFGARVVISPHLGDVGSPRGLALLAATAASLQSLHGVRAATLVCDAHPGFTSAVWAERQGLDVLPVLHHHAHAAAVAGEFFSVPRWLCFTWDGVGLGEDGTLWGGEALLGVPGAWTRVATFRPFAPPGGDQVARQPWRSAAALAWALGQDWSPPGMDVGLARTAWRGRLNCPQSSAVGRLFDAAASFLHLVQLASHEGEGPMALEALAGKTPGDAAVALPLATRDDGVLEADWAPLVPLLCDPTRSPALRAAGFQASLARALVAQAMAVRESHGEFVVGLGGGVFQNRHLSEMALTGLAAAGFRACLPQKIPCNDAGLSFGQVIEAAARQ